MSLAVAFALIGWSASLGATGRAVLFVGAGLIALGSGLLNPSLSSYVSRRADSAFQGATLGAFQSAGALARVLGPAGGGLLYQDLGRAAPYFLGSAGMIVAAVLVLALALDPGAWPPADDLAPLAKEQGNHGI